MELMHLWPLVQKDDVYNALVVSNINMSYMQICVSEETPRIILNVILLLSGK